MSDDRKSPPAAAGAEPDVDGDAYQRYRWAHGYPGYMSSAGWFTYERRFVEWAERSGIDLDYAVSSGPARAPRGRRRATRSWSASATTSTGPLPSATPSSATSPPAAGIASFSGNTMFWQVRLSDDAQADDGAQVRGAPRRPRARHRRRARR